MREIIDAAAPEVMERCIEMAKDGDQVALRLVIERVLPKVGRVVEDELPEVAKRAGDLATGLQNVIRLAAEGRISLEEAKDFARLIELQRRAVETEELSVRLESLERILEGRR